MIEKQMQVIPLSMCIDKDGNVSIDMEEKDRRRIMVTLSQIFCGAFDIAGEHDQLVIDTMVALMHWRKKAVHEREEGSGL